MTNEDFDNEKERLLDIFQQLPKEKQDELLSSEDTLCSWVKENLSVTDQVSGVSAVGAAVAAGAVVGATGGWGWSPKSILRTTIEAAKNLITPDNIPLPREESELVTDIAHAILDYFQKKI